MNKTFYLAFGGQMLVISGLILFFSDKLNLEITKIMVPACMCVVGVCCLLFSRYKKLPNVANQFHFAQGIGFIVYAIILVGLIDSLKGFLLTTIYFIIMFGLFELLFAFFVLNSRHKINKGILMSRIMAGIVNLIGGFVLLLVTFEDYNNGLLFASILFAISGISLLLFSSKVRIHIQ